GSASWSPRSGPITRSAAAASCSPRSMPATGCWCSWSWARSSAPWACDGRPTPAVEPVKRPHQSGKIPPLAPVRAPAHDAGNPGNQHAAGHVAPSRARADREVKSMSDKIYPVPDEWKKRAFLDEAKYKALYARSLSDPNGFWAEEAKRIHWYKAPTR